MPTSFSFPTVSLYANNVQGTTTEPITLQSIAEMQAQFAQFDEVRPITSSNWINLGQVSNVTFTPTAAYYPIVTYDTAASASTDTSVLTYYNYNFQMNVPGIITGGYVASNYYGQWTANETEEQVAARTAQYEVSEKKRIAAEAKAEELLLMCLNDLQKEVYLKHGYLEINTDKAKYRIKKGWSKNIEKIGVDGKAEICYCIHPEILVPTADNMLAQKLMIQYNEEEFLRLANKWDVKGETSTCVYQL